MKIKRGTTRTVFLINRYAIKIPTTVDWPLFLSGLLANMQEATFSTMKSDKLCPVIFSFPGGFFNVMPRCQSVTLAEYAKHLVELENWPVPVENKLDSVGWLNGKIVAVDYGN